MRKPLKGAGTGKKWGKEKAEERGVTFKVREGKTVARDRGEEKE